MVKLQVQTLQNKKYPIEIDEKETVATLKAKIHSELDLGEVEEQKLIHLGKILKNEQTIESAGIKPNAIIVLMISKIKKAAESSSSSSAPAAAPAAAATPAAAPAPAAAAAPATPAAAPAASNPAPAATPAAAPPAAGAAPAAAGAGASPVAANAASALAMGAGLEAMITDLMALGFPRDQVQAALRASFNNPDRAADYLFNGIPDSVLASMAQQGAPRAGGAPPAQGGAPPAQGGAPAVPPPAQQGGGGANANAQANALAQLMAASGQRQGGGGGGGDVGADNPLAGLAASPQFQQMRALLQQQPQLIPVLLQQLSQANPELAQLIAENPEALADLLAGGGGAQGGGGGQGGHGPRTTTISVTMEEKQQLDRLEALGFSRQKSLEAWVLCDRNEELAANYLFDHAYDDENMGGGGGGQGGQGGGQGGQGGQGGGGGGQ